MRNILRRNLCNDDFDMPTFGTKSLSALATCDARLQRLAHEAIKLANFTILEGHRGEAAQNAAYEKGLSKTRWPNGKHNATPALAFDFAPYPIDWTNRPVAIARFAFVAGVLWKCAADLGIRIRFGWDWNRNLDPRDEVFLDWPHVELDA